MSKHPAIGVIISYIGYFSKCYLLYVRPRHTPKTPCFLPLPKQPTMISTSRHPPRRITTYFFIPKIFLFFFSLSLWSLVSLCRPLSDPAAADDDA